MPKTLTSVKHGLVQVHGNRQANPVDRALLKPGELYAYTMHGDATKLRDPDFVGAVIVRKRSVKPSNSETNLTKVIRVVAKIRDGVVNFHTARTSVPKAALI